MSDEISIIFLKSKNITDDRFQKQFSVIKNGIKFDTCFVPVIEHKFKEAEINFLRKILHRRRIGKEIGSKYGGLIFTSQRAVEAFASLVLEGIENGSGDHHDWPYLQDVPIYSVGPATTRALKAIPLDNPLNVRGSESGNGETLASFILSDYSDWYRNWDFKCPLIFVGCERRNNIISKKLMDPNLGMNSIPVVELDVYTTSVIPTFQKDFIKSLNSKMASDIIWIAIFSPSVGEAMIYSLDLLDSRTGRAKAKPPHTTRRIFFASIGPTTRDFLQEQFGFVVDVCAKKPTAESLEEGIMEYLLNEY
ncbi:Uroporphyrinogen-III synthase [Erysiphe neolycopersici]|uniref:Uroporphyrinogen-III synthase n=1 Tax=Erysiphe neolycopersici TaxID=212602 RepID=A0A420HA19_9PEZI|nr:Uroporphyrinogen-III synthase [Erysiphe neolycopersici]